MFIKMSRVAQNDGLFVYIRISKVKKIRSNKSENIIELKGFDCWLKEI